MLQFQNIGPRGNKFAIASMLNAQKIPDDFNAHKYAKSLVRAQDRDHGLLETIFEKIDEFSLGYVLRLGLCKQNSQVPMVFSLPQKFQMLLIIEISKILTILRLIS